MIAVHTITRNRYTTYAIGLAVLGFTGYRLLTEPDQLGRQLAAVGRGPLERHQRAGARPQGPGPEPGAGGRPGDLLPGPDGPLLPPPRVRRDPHRSIGCGPGHCVATALRLAPWAVLPLVAGIWLALEVGWGHEGAAPRRQAKDYWRKNLATYRDAQGPDLTHVDLDLELFPETSRYRVAGTYDLVNPNDQPLREILLTGGLHWEKLSWTFDGKPFTPDRSRAALCLHPAHGPSHQARRPGSASSTKGTFPAASARKAAAPGVHPSLRRRADELSARASCPCWDSATRSASTTTIGPRPKEYPDDFYEGQTDSFLGARAPFTTRIKITGPAEFTINSVGIKTDGHRACRPPHRRLGERPSRQLLQRRRGPMGRRSAATGTAVFYHPGHPYNVDEMLEAASTRHAATTPSGSSPIPGKS